MQQVIWTEGQSKGWFSIPCFNNLLKPIENFKRHSTDCVTSITCGVSRPICDVKDHQMNIVGPRISPNHQMNIVGPRISPVCVLKL